MTDRVFVSRDGWALGSDGVQWILMRGQKGKDPWKGVSFVRSEKAILARCMREKGVGAAVASFLLEGLPETFDQWKAAGGAPVS